MQKESEFELGRCGEYLLNGRIVPEKSARQYISRLEKSPAKNRRRRRRMRTDGRVWRGRRLSDPSGKADAPPPSRFALWRPQEMRIYRTKHKSGRQSRHFVF